MLTIKLSNCFGWSSVCFGSIETSKLSVLVQNQNKLFQNKPKQTKTNQNTLNFLRKIPKCALYHTVSFARLFVSVQSKYLNSLFRDRTETTETKLLFQIVPKLVLVTVLVVSNRNQFRKDTLGDHAVVLLLLLFLYRGVEIMLQS